MTTPSNSTDGTPEERYKALAKRYIANHDHLTPEKREALLVGLMKECYEAGFSRGRKVPPQSGVSPS